MNTLKRPTITTPEFFELINSIEDMQVIDVREPGEYSSAHMPGATSIPLGQLESRAGDIRRDCTVYLICQTGKRAQKASERLKALNIDNVVVVEGGMRSWEASEYPVERSGAWSMERQVRFTAGLLVLTGIALAIVNSTWLCLSAFIALGMMFSAITDTCGMAALLNLLPWNKART